MSNLGNTGQWIASTNGDRFGHIVRSKNLSFDREGYLSLARKAMVLFSESDDADFETPLAIAADTTLAYVVTTGNAFQVDIGNPELTATDLSSGGGQPTFGFQSDVTFYQGTPHFSGTTTVKDYAATNWTSRVTGLSSSYPHPLCVVEHLNQLAVGNGNQVKTYDTSYSNQATLILPSDYVVTWMRWRLGALFIGTRNINGGSAKLFIWNGSGASAQYGYGVQADWIYSGCEYGSAMAVVTSAGQILRCSTGGFDPTPIANLPVYYSPYAWTSNASVSNLLGNVASRGMQASGDLLYLLVNADLAHGAGEANYLSDMPGGLWCFDPNVGLHHRAGVGYDTKLSLTPTGIASNRVVFSTPHQASTGDPVLCVTQSGIAGVNANQIYYAIVDDGEAAEACQLALSPADAIAGRAVALSGAPTIDAFAFDRYESVGASRISSAGPVFVLGTLIPNLFYSSELLFAADVYDGAFDVKGALMSLGMGRNRGHFITAKATAAGIADTFGQIAAFLEGVNLDTDQVVIKYRTRRTFGFPTPLAFSSSATWTSDTTFTIDSTQKDVKSISVGDEIEVIYGAGAGYTSHVIAIDNSSPTYTFTIDESMPVSSGSFDFVADNWTKWAIITTASLKELADTFKSTMDRVQGKWAQFKVELRGREISLQEMQIANAPKQ